MVPLSVSTPVVGTQPNTIDIISGTEMIAKYCLENFNQKFVQHVALHSLALDEYPLNQFYKS